MDPATVLIVDDHEDFLVSVEMVLDFWMPEVEVVTEADPVRALDILRRRRIDAVVADYRMPGMNGLTFLMRAAEIAPEARRVLITAFPDVGVLLRAINEADISYYVRKPTGADELVAMLRDVLTMDARDGCNEVASDAWTAKAVAVGAGRVG